MLPGFRFLFTTVILTVSFLVFGLGAAALLRAAHAQFANLPAPNAASEANLARSLQVREATLAMLRVEMVAQQKDADDKTATEALPKVDIGSDDGVAGKAPDDPGALMPLAGSAPAPASEASAPEAPPSKGAKIAAVDGDPVSSKAEVAIGGESDQGSTPSQANDSIGDTLASRGPARIAELSDRTAAADHAGMSTTAIGQTTKVTKAKRARASRRHRAKARRHRTAHRFRRVTTAPPALSPLPTLPTQQQSLGQPFQPAFGG